MMAAPIKLRFAERNTAIQWASATCSRLVSRFQSFFTSRDASPADPSCLPVAGELAVVVDVPPPSDTDCANLAGPPGQPMTATRCRCYRICIRGFAPDPAHPIVELLQGQELGKVLLVFSVTLITGVLSNQYRHLSPQHASLIMLVLCVGFTATFTGMVLRGFWPRVASMSENIGVMFIFLAFFWLVASFLPPSLAWAAWLCCVLLCLPFFFCMNPLTAEAAVA